MDLSHIYLAVFLNFFYRCVECDKKFSVKRPPRLCDYTGLSFCPDCHWNAMAQTPARIIHNWDFSPRPVSQATKQYLFLMQRKPVIDISQANHKVPSFCLVQSKTVATVLVQSFIVYMHCKAVNTCKIKNNFMVLFCTRKTGINPGAINSPVYWNF